MTDIHFFSEITRDETRNADAKNFNKYHTISRSLCDINVYKMSSRERRLHMQTPRQIVLQRTWF